MTRAEIVERLFALQDLKYRDFNAKLLPTVNPDSIIGVRTPELRRFAKRLVGAGDEAEFLKELPHQYFDENQLHAFIVSEIKDYASCMEELCRFLPFVDNWGTCDQMSPKVFKKYRKDLLPHIQEWISSTETYTVRFGIGMLLEHFLDEDFEPAYPEMVAGIRSEEYYVNMMIAWYFATALAKQYDAVLPFLENNRLAPWTHNKAIQKALESARLSADQKDYLKTLKVHR